MSTEDLERARERLNAASRNGPVYQHHYAAASAGWAFLAVAEAVVGYLKAKTPEYSNPQDLR